MLNQLQTKIIIINKKLIIIMLRYYFHIILSCFHLFSRTLGAKFDTNKFYIVSGGS